MQCSDVVIHSAGPTDSFRMGNLKLTLCNYVSYFISRFLFNRWTRIVQATTVLSVHACVGVVAHAFSSLNLPVNCECKFVSDSTSLAGSLAQLLADETLI